LCDLLQTWQTRIRHAVGDLQFICCGTYKTQQCNEMFKTVDTLTAPRLLSASLALYHVTN